MAGGYATARPPVHEQVIERVRSQLNRPAIFHRALDVGCGAGVSTRALSGFARHCVGLEPAEAMARRGPGIAPGEGFIVGSAETLPLCGGAVDLITAAGSLNYANLDLFFPEAARVLAPGGLLVVYDFSPGRRFPGSRLLDDWYSEFSSRLPSPPNEARRLNPKILSELDSGFSVVCYENFEIGLTLTPAFYLEYVLTETNVAFAARNGVPLEEIRSWCAESLAPVWGGKSCEVLFDPKNGSSPCDFAVIPAFRYRSLTVTVQ